MRCSASDTDAAAEEENGVARSRSCPHAGAHASSATAFDHLRQWNRVQSPSAHRHPTRTRCLLLRPPRPMAEGRRRKRSEERRVGKGCDSTCSYRGSPFHKKKNYQSVTKT